MQGLLRLSRGIDWLSEKIGHTVLWCVLISVLVSAGNATVRKVFDVSSNAWLEVQWYLFAAIYLLCAGYTLLRNEHVRIDVLIHRLPKRTQIMIDIFGILFFLLPAVILIGDLAWPVFVNAFRSGEMSENAGGLIRWPVYLLVPAGFALLAVQAVSELIKRIAFLMGLIEDPTRKKQDKSAEEELAEEIRLAAEKEAEAEIAARAAAQGDRK